MARKSDLPTKLCATCGRPFAWRKKWARDWEAVRYCSKRCASSRKSGAVAGQGSAGYDGGNKKERDHG